MWRLTLIFQTLSGASSVRGLGIVESSAVGQRFVQTAAILNTQTMSTQSRPMPQRTRLHQLSTSWLPINKSSTLLIKVPIISTRKKNPKWDNIQYNLSRSKRKSHQATPLFCQPTNWLKCSTTPNKNLFIFPQTFNIHSTIHHTTNRSSTPPSNHPLNTHTPQPNPLFTPHTQLTLIHCPPKYLNLPLPKLNKIKVSQTSTHYLHIPTPNNKPTLLLISP